MKKLLIILTMLMLSGCGEVEEFIDDFEVFLDDLEQVGEDAVDVVDPTDEANDGSTYEEPEQEPEPEPDPEPTPIDYNPNCDRIYSDHDGGGGFLWKPVSESNGNLAIQLPGIFQRQFDKCEVHTAGLDYPLYWKGWHNWDGKSTGGKYVDDNGHNLRQLWRGTMPGCNYGNGAQVVCEEPKQVCIWQISIGCNRND